MKKKVAIFAPVKNESTYTKIWLDYYSKHIPKEDIYFLDFGSDDLSYHDNVIQSTADILDAAELWESICNLHRKLLDDYEWVIPTDIDEIIYHPDGLYNYLSNTEHETIKCYGYNVIHLPDKEGPLDSTQPILSQRGFWYRDSTYYDKTIVVKKTLTWCRGLHTCKEPADYHDPNLLLIHLHKFDFDKTIERHQRWADLKWSEQTVKNNWTWHYRLKGEDIVKQYWETNGNDIVPIPTILKVLKPF